MNTATRTIGSQGLGVSRARWFVDAQMSFWLGIFFCLLLVSAFSVVYLKDLHRRLYIQYETVEHSNIHARVQWDRLLLTQGTRLSQARVQRIAQQRLQMIVPKAKNIVLVETPKVELSKPAANS